MEKKNEGMHDFFFKDEKTKKKILVLRVKQELKMDRIFLNGKKKEEKRKQSRREGNKERDDGKVVLENFGI